MTTKVYPAADVQKLLEALGWYSSEAWKQPLAYGEIDHLSNTQAISRGEAPIVGDKGKRATETLADFRAKYPGI